MPYFHATAVFEARSPSGEEADRAVAALLKALRHPRVLYYEHDTSEGVGPYRPAGPLYFTVIADFDVEASSEEGAVDVIEEALDAASSETIQYLALGITPGERRVRPEQRAARAGEYEPEPETRPGPEERGERGGRTRGARGRGRRRRGAQEAEEARKEETGIEAPAPPHEVSAHVEAALTATPAAKETLAEGAIPEREQPAPAPVTAEAVAPTPPPRSSAAMRVTLAVTLHASELTRPTNGSTVPDQELIRLATAEALRRHPELPAEVAPECEVVALPWGDTVLTLTWHYDVPVPSAAEAA